MKKLSLKQKLMFSFVMLALIPMGVSGYLSYRKAEANLRHDATQKLNSIAQLKSDILNRYFSESSRSLANLAQNPFILNAFKELNTAFFELDKTVDATVAESDMARFYKDSFSKVFKEKSGQKEVESNSILASLDRTAQIAQWQYVYSNPHPIGEKNNWMQANTGSPYDRSHSALHPYLNELLTKNGYYDIFLINNDGRVVYTVYKETDFGTSLIKGPWKNSGLAKAFQRSKTMKAGETSLLDFELYYPSYQAPAAFLISPLFDGGRRSGAIAIQFPLDQITAVLEREVGLGKNSESYLVGLEDRLLRSDSKINKSMSVIDSFRDPDKHRIQHPALELSLKQDEGITNALNLKGVEALSAFSKVNILGNRWVLITEAPTEEIFASLKDLLKVVISIMVIALVGSILFAYALANGISKSLRVLVKGLGKTSDSVRSSSNELNSTSSALAESSTEQAASLQESVASLQEISAMVKQNADSSTESRKVALSSKEAAELGQTNVKQMQSSMMDIDQAMEDIQQQVENNNQEFSGITKIIDEIVQKTKVINDIAFQTKLLSFNASVEAARAGAHGLGFAVVAEEVGNLANVSATAARSIAQLLSDSSSKVQSIVSNSESRMKTLITQGKETVQGGRIQAERCGKSLEQILKQAIEVEDRVEQISLASKEQSQGIQEIMKAVSQLDQTTQQNSASSQRTAKQAEFLRVQSQELRSFVNELSQTVEGSVGGDSPKESGNDSGHTKMDQSSIEADFKAAS